MIEDENGGPAFAYGSWEHGGDSGMTLRDYFAGQVDGLDVECDEKYAGFFNADKKPAKDDWGGWAKWFAKADANLRYIRADAMLEARKAPTGEAR